MQNPWAIVYEEIKLFEKGWEKDYHLALSNIDRGNIKIASLLLRPYMFLPSFRSKAQEILKKSTIFQELNTLVEKKAFGEALLLAEKHVELQASQNYKKCKKSWNVIVNYALSLIEDDAQFFNSKIKRVVSPFLVANLTKDLAHALIYSSTIFIEFKRLISSKDIIELFIYVKKYPFLKELELFEKISSRVDVLINRAAEHENKKEYSKALEILELVVIIPSMKSSATEMISLLKSRIKIKELLERDNFAAIVPIFTENPSLISSVEHAEFLEEFEKRAKKIVQKNCAKCSEAKLILKSFINVKGFRKRVKKIFEIVYINEIKKALSEGESRECIKKGLENFIRYFGTTKEIVEIAKRVDIKIVATYNRAEIDKISPNEYPISILK